MTGLVSILFDEILLVHPLGLLWMAGSQLHLLRQRYLLLCLHASSRPPDHLPMGTPLAPGFKIIYRLPRILIITGIKWLLPRPRPIYPNDRCLNLYLAFGDGSSLPIAEISKIFPSTLETLGEIGPKFSRIYFKS